MSSLPPIIDQDSDATNLSHTALLSTASQRRSSKPAADAVVPALSTKTVGEFPESKQAQQPSSASSPRLPDDSAWSLPENYNSLNNQVRVQVQDKSEIMSSLSEPRFPETLKNNSSGDVHDEEDTDSSMLGQNLKRRLMDIESSFIPDGGAALPATTVNSAGPSASRGRGVDDTFLFGGSPGRTGYLAKTSPPQQEESEVTSSVMLPSSPTAAAMQRVLNKTNSGGRPSQVAGLDSGKVLGEDEENVVPTQRRPDFLQNRQSSQRSSISSILARSDISGGTDNTVGADYAIHSGGAAPMTSGHSNSNSNASLPRLPSLGSITSLNSSGQSDATSKGRAADANTLSRLDEEDGLTRTSSQPETPRAASFGTAGIAPSDTVIAQHVQNIKVPETVARDFRAKTIGMSYSTRSRANLTLKEQNNKIDKLSKENFDLKLKIHFLDQALQNRSDEGVKDMISKNVQLQTDLANEKKENQGLRRKIRELERRVKAQEENRSDGNRDADDEAGDMGGEERAELEEEITYLRETLQQMQTEVTRLKDENLSKEVEKRRLGDYVRTMGEQRRSAETSPRPDVDEMNEMWKDLLQQETARRESADDDAARLREENKRLKSDLTFQQQQTSGLAGAAQRATDSRASTLVEQLKHENAELRRDLGAQTSMLTSRNRERERLQQEIEDLKLQSRRGGLDVPMGGGTARSIAGDSIFDRSVSRQHVRSSSRASGMTRITNNHMNAAEMHSAIAGPNSAIRDVESEQEREEMERTLDTLRDELARIKMLNQDLETALNEHLDGLESLEQENKQLREEGTLALEDLQALQTERDDLLASIEAKDGDFTELRSQAVEEIDKLQDELEQKDADFEALRVEFKGVSETAVKLEDDLAASRRNEASLESQIAELEREIEGLDEKIREITAKNERLEVQLESSQNETAFLREEQEGDKIKIGELEAALAASEIKIEDMLAQIKEEKRQREMLDSQEKADIQKLLDEINLDNVNAKDENRKLSKKLSDKEREAEMWKERFETLESDLREALGDMNGTRSTILKDVTKLQRDLEHTLSALEISRQDLAEKDGLLRTRDNLLESSSLENKKLSDLLDKERSARKADRAAWELMQRSQQSLTRTIQQSDTRVSEIETARQSDRRKHATLEKKLREQLNERNTLLLNLWTNLSSLCGPEFNKKHALISSPGGSSMDTLEKHFSTFSRDVSAAIKAIESMFGSFRGQIRELEKKMWKEVQGLERALELRTKRVDHVEKMMSTISTSRAVEAQHSQQSIPSRSISSRSGQRDEHYYAKLKSENKLLKQEVQVLRNSAGGAVPDRGSSQRGRDREKTLRHFTGSVGQDMGQSPQHVALDPTVTVPSLPPPEYGSRNASPTNSGSPNRRASLHAGVGYHARQTSADVLHSGLTPQQYQHGAIGQPGSSSEQRWVHRLKELERRLKAEREARLLDRSGARKRIEESEAEKERLRQRLEHELERRGSLEEGEMGTTTSEPANMVD